MRFFEKVPVKVEGMVQGSAEYVLIEIKSLFSIILTHLGPNGSTFNHTHPFNAITIWLYGFAVEGLSEPFKFTQKVLHPGTIKYTEGAKMHSITSGSKGAWFLTFRGPWGDKWLEVSSDGKLHTLTHGRKEVQ